VPSYLMLALDRLDELLRPRQAVTAHDPTDPW